MNSFEVRRVSVAVISLLLVAHTWAAEIEEFGYEVVNVFPHDENAFTQGLFFRDGDLFESTGQYGSSTIRRVSVATGQVLHSYELADRYFGEGIVDSGDRIIGLTWRAGVGVVLGIDDFELEETFRYEGEGWGLTRNSTHIIMSDGTDNLRFLDKESLEVTRNLRVTLRGESIRSINELEWIDGALFANVWRTDWLLRIDADTGVVTGLVNLADLLPLNDRRPGHTNVLNGIAFDAENDRLFVTGKNWPSLFEISLVRK